jgi:preprotein translocase subunit SecD
MVRRNLIYLLFILVLAAAVTWVDLPNNGGLHILGFDRSLNTQFGLDLRGGLRVLLEVDLPADAAVSSQSLEDAKTILENRSNALGVSEVLFQIAGPRRIVGEFPGVTDTSQVIATLKEVGQLALVPMGANPLPAGSLLKVDLTKIGKSLVEILSTPTPVSKTTPTATPAVLPNTQTNSTQPTVETSYPAILTGADLQSVTVTNDNLGKYQIAIVFKDSGKQIFADYTTNHVGDFIAFVLDGKVISTPRVSTAITGGQGVISGNFTYESATSLAVQLRYGSLPVPLKVVESRAVGATLSQDSVDKSVRAGAIGIIIIILFMILSYRLPGVIASLALILYAATNFALYKVIPVTLTLPGIAGFILSMGVAVDANILIFERLKEELRAGRTLRNAIDLAWKRAWPSIRDSNITTLITCTILYWFGSTFGASLVKGFALNLALGVLISLFTAVVVTRTILHVVLDNIKFAEHHRWFTA